MLYFWLHDGIQIFSIDPVFDLLISRHLILLFQWNSSKLAWQYWTASLVVVSWYTSPVLSVCHYSLLWKLYSFQARPRVRSGCGSRQAWMYYFLLWRFNQLLIFPPKMALIPDSANWPRVVESVVGLVPVEHSPLSWFHKYNCTNTILLHVFIAINILCKFGEDIFINEWDKRLI